MRTWSSFGSPVRRTQAYVDEAGNVVAIQEFEPNLEPWRFAQVLPSIPENYRCLACAQVFQQHPGAAVQCPRCGHLYAAVETLA